MNPWRFKATYHSDGSEKTGECFIFEDLLGDRMKADTAFNIKQVGNLSNFVWAANCFNFVIWHEPCGGYTHKIRCSMSDFRVLVELANE